MEMGLLTTQQLDHPASAAPAATARTVTTHETAIMRIMDETGCDALEAQLVITWYLPFIRAAREDGYFEQHPHQSDLASAAYPLVDQVTPHGAQSRPGSAHAALEEHLLDPARGELGLQHDMSGGVARYCSITVTVAHQRV
jgi:hypothetical protein